VVSVKLDGMYEWHWARGIQADAVAIESKRTVEIDRFADRKEVDEYFTNLIGPARRGGLIEVI
jgi:hypothetical protein